MFGNMSPFEMSMSTDSLDHQHFRAGFLQNNNNFVWLGSTFLDLDKDLDAALDALLAKDAIRDLDLDLDEVEALEVTGAKLGDSGGVGGGAVLRRTNSNDRTTHLEGSSDLLPHLPEDSNPDEHNISNKCCSAGPKF